MVVGEIIRIKPETFGEGQFKSGRVVYVHPKGRFYTVEFFTKSGSLVRESFVTPRKTRQKPMYERVGGNAK